MWAKFAAAFTVGAILLVALIIFVNHNNTDSNQTLTPSEQAKVNREAERVVAADQAPQRGHADQRRQPARRVRAHRPPGDVRPRQQGRQVDGPLQRVRCTRHGGAAGQLGFSCVATADDVNYDFVGVVDVPARRLTYCKRDEPPVPSQNIPVSAACTA